MSTSSSRVLILDTDRIHRKLRRMAYQIWEHNSDESSIVFLGIEQGGLSLAKTLAAILEEISGMQVTVEPMNINKRHPIENLPVIKSDLNGKSVVLVDDVANSGKTLLYALKPLLEFEPKKILIAVLVDRKHKTFPIVPDIVGHRVSTTLQEHITVEIQSEREMLAYLH